LRQHQILVFLALINVSISIGVFVKELLNSIKLA
jgi:hypothetical protein